MRPFALVGNDLVCLTSSEVIGKVDDRRFVERVTDPAERVGLTDDLSLWRLWAAKEAAFKIAIKRDPETVFAQRRFVVARDRVYHGEDVYWVTWSVVGPCIHCVATVALVDPSRITAAVERDEGASSSVAARALATRILADRGLAGAEIVRERIDDRRLGPPMALWGGQRCGEVDLSLSHHGGFIAAAIAC